MVWLLLLLMLMGHLILVAHVQIQRCALGSRTDSASVQCLMLGIGTQFVEHADKKKETKR